MANKPTIVYCWGNTANGQLGLGDIEDNQICTPCHLTYLDDKPVKDIACGVDHTLFLVNGGVVYSCGNNDHGQLGHNKACRRPERIDMPETEVITAVACGAAHSIAVNDRGQLFTWGRNNYFQLGRQTASSNTSIPSKVVMVLGQFNVIQVACGFYHTLALTDDGQLFSWGCNSNGQLGIGTNDATAHSKSLSSINRVSILRGVGISFIAAGSRHSVVLTVSGALFAWGCNKYGQLGVGDETDRSLPTLVQTLHSERVKYVACGEDHTVLLTQDGGVFTFGAGMNGQLGHANLNSQTLPRSRKVIELMGSSVSMVACGRRHTIAYVPASGRLRACGLGSNGQLGINSNANQPQPCPVVGLESVAIVSVYSGGGQSFVLADSKSENEDNEPVVSRDFRVRPPHTQIATLTKETVYNFQKMCGIQKPSTELQSQIEKVFSSSCLNASFLLQGDAHYSCSSKNHGVAIADAEEIFNVIGELKNEYIKQIIAGVLERKLIPTLTESSPRHVEALRIFLTLPYLHFFCDPEFYITVICPFAHALLHTLNRDMNKVLESWWCLLGSSYLLRIVQIYKRVLLFILNEPTATTSEQMFRRQRGQYTCMEMLKKLKMLHDVNQSSGSTCTGVQLIPDEEFYVPEFKDKVDLLKDFVHFSGWKLPTEDDSHTDKLPMGPDGTLHHYGLYPFLFDDRAKKLLKVLFQIYASIHMQHEERGALRLSTMEGLGNLIRLHNSATDGNDKELESILLSTTVDQTGRTARDLINAGDQIGETALHKAARSFKRRLQCVDILLRHGANVKAVDAIGFQPLHEACEVGMRELHNPLCTVSEEDELATVNLILESGADVNATTNVRNTPLHLTRNVKIVSKLLKYGANPNAQNVMGRTPLHLVDNVAATEALCDAGADPSIKDEFGYTALHLVSTAQIDGTEIIKMMKILISKKEHVNLRSGLGLTPLHCACMASDVTSKNLTIPLLMKNGAKGYIADVFGASPLHYLFAVKVPDHERPMIDFEILEALLQNGWSSLHRSIVNGKTPFQVAAENGWVPDDWQQKPKTEDDLSRKANKVMPDDVPSLPLDKLETLLQTGCNSGHSRLQIDPCIPRPKLTRSLSLPCLSDESVELDAFSGALLKHVYHGVRTSGETRPDLSCKANKVMPVDVPLLPLDNLERLLQTGWNSGHSRSQIDPCIPRPKLTRSLSLPCLSNESVDAFSGALLKRVCNGVRTSGETRPDLSCKANKVMPDDLPLLPLDNLETLLQTCWNSGHSRSQIDPCIPRPKLTRSRSLPCLSNESVELTECMQHISEPDRPEVMHMRRPYQFDLLCPAAPALFKNNEIGDSEDARSIPRLKLTRSLSLSCLSNELVVLMALMRYVSDQDCPEGMRLHYRRHSLRREDIKNNEIEDSEDACKVAQAATPTDCLQSRPTCSQSQGEGGPIFSLDGPSFPSTLCETLRLFVDIFSTSTTEEVRRRRLLDIARIRNNDFKVVDDYGSMRVYSDVDDPLPMRPLRPIPAPTQHVHEIKDFVMHTSDQSGTFSLENKMKLLTDALCEKKPSEEWSKIMSVANKENFHSCMKSHATSFVGKIMSKVASIDSRFRCEQCLVGSCCEGTRASPDEFDILVILSTFGDSLLTTESKDFPGFVSFKPKLATSSLLEFCDSDGVLHPMVVKDKLYRLLVEAVSYPDAWGDESYESLSLRISVKRNSPAITLHVGREHPPTALYDGCRIDIDLVPVIPTGMTLPNSTPLSQYVSANCGSVDRRLLATMKWPKCSLVVPNSLWETSCPVVESEVLRSAAESVKKSYMMLKRFVLCSTGPTGLSQYALKSCVLHCIVNEMLDDVHVDDLDESMKDCVRVILHRWWTCLVNGECPNVANPERYLPVWNNVPSPRFKKLYMSRHGVPYLPNEKFMCLKVSPMTQNVSEISTILTVHYLLSSIRRLCEDFEIPAIEVDATPGEISDNQLRDVVMFEESSQDRFAKKFYKIHATDDTYKFESSHVKRCTT